MNNNPIGVFDSGVGGLSVLKSIRERLPHEDLIYIADLLYVPYGDKSQQLIEQRAINLSYFLIQHNVKAIVVACNTATVTAIKKLRSLISIPIIGIEPGVKPASLSTKTGSIGVLATSRTLKSDSFSQLLNNWVAQHRVELQACPGLVEQVESLDLNGPKTRRLLKQYIDPLLEKGVDTLVLGCTHYPFLIPLIREICDHSTDVIDTGPAVAREVERRLQVAQLLSSKKTLGYESFWSSAATDSTTKIIGQLWGDAVNVSLMDNQEIKVSELC